MMILGTGVLILIAISALAIVRTDNVRNQLLAVSFYGLLLGLMFFIFQAPDVALSQITIGAIALPLMLMLALTRMKHRESISAGEKEKPHE